MVLFILAFVAFLIIIVIFIGSIVDTIGDAFGVFDPPEGEYPTATCDICGRQYTDYGNGNWCRHGREPSTTDWEGSGK